MSISNMFSISKSPCGFWLKFNSSFHYLLNSSMDKTMVKDNFTTLKSCLPLCYQLISNNRINKRKMKMIHKEYRCLINMLAKSNLNFSSFHPSTGILTQNGFNLHARHFHSSSLLNQKNSPDRRNGNNRSRNDEEKEDDDDEPKSSLLAKAAIWMLTGYMVITIMSLLFPTSNQPDVLRYVSWNEFVHQMLAKGEVEQLVVRPELDLVTIYLHDGAIIKGKKAEHKTYHMNIVNVPSFEKRLKEAERRFGIRPEHSIPVVYERNQESTWLLLVSLVAVALMILIMFRSGQIKTPQTMDFFVNNNNYTY